MENHQENSIDKAARREALKRQMALRKVGAVPDAYFFSVMGALLVCAAALLALFNFGPKMPDGTFDISVIKQWEEGHPFWLHLIVLTVAAIEMAALDVCGWKIGALIARRHYRENITMRRVAFWRLGVQIALAAVVTLLFALFPQKFPHPNGHFPFMLFGFFGIPIALAALYLRRASRAPLQ